MDAWGVECMGWAAREWRHWTAQETSVCGRELQEGSAAAVWAAEAWAKGSSPDLAQRPRALTCAFLTSLSAAGRRCEQRAGGRINASRHRAQCKRGFVDKNFGGFSIFSSVDIDRRSSAQVKHSFVRELIQSNLNTCDRWFQIWRPRWDPWRFLAFDFDFVRPMLVVRKSSLLLQSTSTCTILLDPWTWCGREQMRVIPYVQENELLAGPTCSPVSSSDAFWFMLLLLLRKK